MKVDVDMISRLLSQLDPAKSAGSDVFPAQFLIRCFETITVLIFILSNRSFGGGHLVCVEACLHHNSPQKRF